jgi:hypothetical protein
MPSSIPLGATTSAPVHDAVVGQGGRAGRVLLVGDAEEDERLQPQIDAAPNFFGQAVEAELIVAGHRGDFFLDAAAGADEEGEDEVIDGQGCLADELPHQGMMA